MSSLRRFAGTIYSRFFYSPHWRVGWRRRTGPDLWERQSLRGTRWQVLPNPPGRFLADPIAITVEGRTVLFMEDFDHHRQKGVISAIEFSESGPASPLRRVLEEPWHLSYPFVMAGEGGVWMIPESSANREVALYRADPFPDRWVREATLIRGLAACDATVIAHEGRLWLLATVETETSSCADLHVFSAERLCGPWRAHAGNPVLRDPRVARSAGPMVRRGGRLWRPVQDCARRYGAAVGLTEILRLDDGGYVQATRAVIGPCRAWPGRRLHTLSQAGPFEFIDGSANAVRWPGSRPPA
ncbi:glucosamine inositolphosphorylceramide transferase family protein [Methylobacterium sp. JK268]